MAQPAEEELIDPTLASIATRLADEGIPVRAIARGLKIPSDDLYTHLNEAIVLGHILELPKDDWPPGSSRAQRVIYAGTILENPEQLKSMCVRCFKVTRQQGAVLSTLLRRPEMTKGQIHSVLQENRPNVGRDPTDERLVDVVVCHLRKKLKAWDITIETMWGTGYLISQACRLKAIAALDEYYASTKTVGAA